MMITSLEIVEHWKEAGVAIFIDNLRSFPIISFISTIILGVYRILKRIQTYICLKN